MPETQLDDCLFQRAQAGDGAALGKLMQGHNGVLRAQITRKLPNRCLGFDADDVLQDVWIDGALAMREAAIGGASEFFRRMNARAGRRTIDRLRFASRTKRGGGRVLDEQAMNRFGADSRASLEALVAPGRTPLNELIHREVLDAVPPMIESLPRAEREVLRLRYLDGEPLRTIALRMGRSRGAVAKLCQRGCQAARRRLRNLDRS